MVDTVDAIAEIIPGKGAAGFHLGNSIQNVKSDIAELKEWQRTGGLSLYEAIRSTSGWLSNIREIDGGEVLYFGRGMIELHFNAKGILYKIFVTDGYAGVLWGQIKVGSALSLVQNQCPLEYDDGDEMHYPVDTSIVSGIGFYAEEAPLDEAPDQIISSISVHSWSFSK